MTVATPVLPNYTTDTGAEYPLNIDAALAVSAEVAHQFAPHPTEPPSMQVRVAPGRKQLPDGTLIEKPAQTSGVIAAPAANPRHDLVVIDNATANLEIIEGAEAADPADPA